MSLDNILYFINDFIELYWKINFYTSHACIFSLYKTSCDFPRVAVGSKFCINIQIFIVICHTSETRGNSQLVLPLYYYIIACKTGAYIYIYIYTPNSYVNSTKVTPWLIVSLLYIRKTP